eukprot:gene426-6839_t
MSDRKVKEAQVLPITEKSEKKESSIYLPKRKLLSTISHGDLSLREFDNLNCDGSTIIEGIPNQSENLSLSLMIAHFIVEQLDLPLIGELYSPSLEPTCVVENGVVSHSIRIYGNQHVVVFTSEYEIPSEFQNDAVQAILGFAQRHRCKIILSVRGLETDPNKKEKYSLQIRDEDEFLEEGIDGTPKTKEDLIKLIEETKEKRGDEKLWFSTNDEIFAKKLISMEHKPLQDVILTGISAGLLVESCYTDLVIACLFSKLNELQKYISVDARAAIALVVCISELLSESGGAIIDVKEMDKDISKLEESMIKIITKLNTLGSSHMDSHLYL